MKAMVIEKFGKTEEIRLKEVPRPKISENEVLIKVVDAGMNPVDWKIREGDLKAALPHEFPIILGWDVSGIVTEVGKNVKSLQVGDEVFAYVRKHTVQNGAYAEYVAFDAKEVAKKPKSISFAQAASLPLASLTAWQGLFDIVQLKKGETLLVVGGGGGVGCMAIQFAKYAGAKVVATARKEKHSYVKQFGADFVVDRNGDFTKEIKAYLKEGVDVIFDCVGGEFARRALSLLKKGGRFISLLEEPSSEETRRLGITASSMFVSPNGEQLRKIADLIETHKVVPPHLQEMSLKEATKALAKLRTGDVLGKIVLKAIF